MKDCLKIITTPGQVAVYTLHPLCHVICSTRKFTAHQSIPRMSLMLFVYVFTTFPTLFPFISHHILTRSLKLLLKSPSSPLSTNVLALVSYSGLLWLSGKWFILWVSSFNYSPRCVGLAACFCQLANQQVNLTQLVVGWAEPQTKNKGRHTQNY